MLTSIPLNQSSSIGPPSSISDKIKYDFARSKTYISKSWFHLISFVSVISMPNTKMSHQFLLERRDLGRPEYYWQNLNNLNFFILECLTANKNQEDSSFSSDDITDYSNLKLNWLKALEQFSQLELKKSFQLILLGFNLDFSPSF